MDSGNSGSMQSSSGGDEEYDSRAESISAFFNSPTTGDVATLPNLPPPPPTSHHHHHPPPFYDTLSYLDSNPNPFLNLDIPWSRTFRPSSSSSLNPNFTDIATLIPSSSFSPSLPTAPLDRPYSPIALTPPPVQQTAAASAPRSSKKRSRASRRAPTTVLTTDTSNFRAMVQEFTGIPAPPFAAASSAFPRPRFDLFHPSTFRSSQFSDAPPPYILRPFAQKVHAPPIGSSATNTASSSNAIPNTSISMTTTTTINPLLNFQSLLQSAVTPNYTLPTMPAFASAKSQASSEANYGAGGELGLLIASEGMRSRGQGDELSGWAGGSVMAEGSGDQAQLIRPVVGNYGTSQRASNCKLNYSALASSELHAEKGSESMPARSEGMMDSWICTSD